MSKPAIFGARGYRSRKFMRTYTIIAIAAFLAIQTASSQAGHTVTAAMVEQWMTDLSNWGRWGKLDQLGAVNRITPSKRKSAPPLETETVSWSLARNTDTAQPDDDDWHSAHPAASTRNLL